MSDTLSREELKQLDYDHIFAELVLLRKECVQLRAENERLDNEVVRLNCMVNLYESIAERVVERMGTGHTSLEDSATELLSRMTKLKAVADRMAEVLERIKSEVPEGLFIDSVQVTTMISKALTDYHALTTPTQEKEV